MNPEDAIEAYRAVTSDDGGRPPCLALHWGTFRLTDEPVEEPPVAICTAMERGRVAAGRELDARDRRDEAHLTRTQAARSNVQSFIGGSPWEQNIGNRCAS